MSTIPNGISAEDLQNLLEAKEEAEIERESVDETDNIRIKTPTGTFSVEDIELMAQACDEALFEQCAHPIAHKVMMLGILDKMIHWHEKTALDKEGIPAMGWAADAGILHAVKNLLISVSFGPDDFTSVYREE